MQKKVQKRYGAGYFGSEEVASMVKNAAMVVGSGLPRIIGNLFLKFASPKYPVKIFNDLDKATMWLKNQNA